LNLLRPPACEFLFWRRLTWERQSSDWGPCHALKARLLLFPSHHRIKEQTQKMPNFRIRQRIPIHQMLQKHRM
jgi:hypothetical protein